MCISDPDPAGEAFVPAVNSTHDPLYRQVLMGGVIACSVIVVVSIIGGVIVCYRLGKRTTLAHVKENISVNVYKLNTRMQCLYFLFFCSLF